MKRQAKKRLTVIVSALALLSVLLSALVIPVLANTGASGETEYDAEIMKVKGGRDAIATFTFADGMTATANTAWELFSERNFPVSLMVVPTRVMGIPPYTTEYYASAAELRQLTESGLVEVQSHSYSHIYIVPEGSPDYKAENCTDANRYREIVGSRDWIAANFPGIDQLTFAKAGGAYDDATEALIRETYYAARYSDVPEGVYQSLTPASGSELGGWYSLYTKWLKEAKIDGIKEYLDTCDIMSAR